MEPNSGDYFDIIENEFGEALGALESAYREKVTLYIAHLDRNGKLILDVEGWIKRAESVLSRIGGGATSLLVRGAYLGNAIDPLHEPTTLVYCFAEPRSIVNSVHQLRDFLHLYGQEANQSEVVLSLENPDGNWFFRVPRKVYNP